MIIVNKIVIRERTDTESDALGSVRTTFDRAMRIDLGNPWESVSLRFFLRFADGADVCMAESVNSLDEELRIMKADYRRRAGL